MKKIIGLLAILLLAILTITACGGKKTDTKKTSSTSKSKVSKTISKSSQSSSATTNSDISASTSESVQEHLHGEAEESQWSQQSSEAAKVMTVAGQDKLCVSLISTMVIFQMPILISTS